VRGWSRKLGGETSVMERASLCPGRGGEEGKTLAVCSAIVEVILFVELEMG
jgi:hypothetical protein